MPLEHFVNCANKCFNLYYSNRCQEVMSTDGIDSITNEIYELLLRPQCHQIYHNVKYASFHTPVEANPFKASHILTPFDHAHLFSSIALTLIPNDWELKVKFRIENGVSRTEALRVCTTPEIFEYLDNTLLLDCACKTVSIPELYKPTLLPYFPFFDNTMPFSNYEQF